MTSGLSVARSVPVGACQTQGGRGSFTGHLLNEQNQAKRDEKNRPEGGGWQQPVRLGPGPGTDPGVSFGENRAKRGP